MRNRQTDAESTVTANMRSDALACIATRAYESAYLVADLCDACDPGLDFIHFEYGRHGCEAYATARPMQNQQ